MCRVFLVSLLLIALVASTCQDSADKNDSFEALYSSISKALKQGVDRDGVAQAVDQFNRLVAITTPKDRSLVEVLHQELVGAVDAHYHQQTSRPTLAPMGSVASTPSTPPALTTVSVRPPSMASPVGPNHTWQEGALILSLILHLAFFLIIICFVYQMAKMEEEIRAIRLVQGAYVPRRPDYLPLNSRGRVSRHYDDD
ncbi:hypothetical protein TYRP_022417 [Tyrophagus putrescentiae]|nr:hypothetical protein TYRP_022417 [Tyrophagus putrescentiae]